MRQTRSAKKKSKKVFYTSASVGVLTVLVAISLLVGQSRSEVNDANDESKQNELVENTKSIENTKVEEKPASSDGEKKPEVVKEPELPKENVSVQETESKEPAKEQVNNPVVEKDGTVKPTYVNNILIVNKTYALPKNYNPGENKEARAAFEQMAAAAKKEGYTLVAFSTFRSYEYQQNLYNNYVKKDGQEKADRYSAKPGHSEHQTGLAFDIGEKGQEKLWLQEAFGESAAGKWLVNNAHRYGFILRYPKGKESITGYMYESWHFRYLGTETAKKVYDSKLTLEEYLGL